MLVDLLISRAARGPGKMDMHMSATLNCRLNALLRRASRFFG
ncbi:hypothetical protein [Microbaculum marinum]|uniref:Uncharacterized protein n=1 Tax=Microbaculum marinum TaxID=1764581 RepID=A0AAW9RPF5_9HYPH